MQEKPYIAAVIVTFNPPGDFFGRVGDMSHAVNKIIIVDNGSDEEFKTTLQQCDANLREQLEIISNEKNEGLAHALNQGIRQALNHNADWVLLLDHDSQAEPGMVEKMLAAYDSHSEKEKIGLIAPEIKDENIAAETKYLVPKGKFWFRRITLNTEYNDDVLTVITSGSLIKAEIFNKVGLMPEHFFIDYIDHVFCLTLKSAGYKILLVRGAILKHRLGEKTEHRFLGSTLITPHHNAMRRYYIFRNRIWVWKRFIATFPNFILHDLFASCFDILRVMIYEQKKWQKLKSIIRGICAGLCRETKQLTPTPRH